MRTKGASGYLALSAACMVFMASMGVLTVRAVQMKHVGLPPEVGGLAPRFELEDGRGHAITSLEARGSILVLCFVGEKCPVSADYGARVQSLANSYRNEGVKVIRVEVGANKMPVELMDDDGVTTFLDRSGSVANRFGVTVTPTFCLVDAAGQLGYSGAMDDNRNFSKVKTRYLADALKSMVRGQPVGCSSTQAFGCAISPHPN